MLRILKNHFVKKKERKLRFSLFFSFVKMSGIHKMTQLSFPAPSDHNSIAANMHKIGEICFSFAF